MYVDDILLIGNDIGYLNHKKIDDILLQFHYAMQFQMTDLGDAQYVLGIQIVQNLKNRTLAMS